MFVVGFWWSVKFSYEEQVGVVLDVSWPLPFPVIAVNTSGSSCHTPVADMIKWAGCLVPHGCPLYGTISAPLLVYYLETMDVAK